MLPAVTVLKFTRPARHAVTAPPVLRLRLVAVRLMLPCAPVLTVPLVVRLPVSRTVTLPLPFSGRPLDARYARDCSSDVCSSDVFVPLKLDTAFAPFSVV